MLYYKLESTAERRARRNNDIKTLFQSLTIEEDLPFMEAYEALRPQVEEAVEELIAERGLPKSFTGTILYHGFKIRVQRPTSYTWEKNNNIEDDRLAYYKEQHALYLQLQRDCKHLRADIKHTGNLLAEDYPDSQSIKHGLTIALMK